MEMALAAFEMVLQIVSEHVQNFNDFRFAIRIQMRFQHSEADETQVTSRFSNPKLLEFQGRVDSKRARRSRAHFASSIHEFLHEYFRYRGINAVLKLERINHGYAVGTRDEIHNG